MLLALTAITLLTVDLRGFGPVESGQRVVRDVLHPVTTLALSLFSPVSDAWNAVFDYDDLEDENAALQAEIDELRGGVIRTEADLAAYLRLLDAVDLPYREDIPSVTAKVVRGSVGNFADNVVTIEKGARDGITEGMAVVTGAGLVGRVDRVDGATATVQLLTDPGLLVGVRLVATGDLGLGHPVVGEAGLFVVDQGPRWPDVDDPSLLPGIGTAVVTSAISRYPSDVPIGTVVAVALGADELTMEITVMLAADVTSLNFVSILLTEQIDEPPLQPVVPNTIVPLDFDPSVIDQPDGAP